MEENITYKLSLFQILYSLRYTMLWISALFFLYSKSDNLSSVIWIIFLFSPFVIPSFVLLFQYIYYSLGNNSKITFTSSKFLQEIERIEKHQSKVDEKGRDIGFLPWLSGTFYYYKIKLKTGEEILITCLMDSKNFPFENFINENNIQVESKGYFYPWIL